MQIETKYSGNLKVSAEFDDFIIKSDQPIRYKGDGSAPGPFDYFLASSAMCAAYFVKVYCKSRNIPTDDIKVTQDNVVCPENRYKQKFIISVETPSYISQKDKDGIIRSIDRCTVKRTIQEGVEFIIEQKEILKTQNHSALDEFINSKTYTLIKGKDSSLEETIRKFSKILDKLNIKIEISSWRNPAPNIWSVHIRDAQSPMNFANGKGNTKESALCSALGEYLERLSTNYFYNDYFLGDEISTKNFVHYPDEKWFAISNNNKIPDGILDKELLKYYNPKNDLKASHLIDSNSGNSSRGICALPFTRLSDHKIVYFPVNILSNLYVSNGMSAGNSDYEARVQCLSEIIERAVKTKIIKQEISLPDVPKSILKSYPMISEAIKSLENRGYPILVKDASLGGKFPVMNVTLLNPKTGGIFSSYGAHPNLEVALERSLTELMQGRSFEGLNEMPQPTFNQEAVAEHNNIIDHFIDSSGVVSWKFLNKNNDYPFVDWNFEGTTKDEYQFLTNLLSSLGKEIYIASYDDLGVSACRIIVPDFSEIYSVEDLVWDNNNLSLKFRDSILSIHQLSLQMYADLLARLDENQIDEYKPISELIGIAFDENSPWEELTVGELKGLCHLALGNLEEAKQYTEQLSIFNDFSEKRKSLYRLIDTLLDIYLNDKNLLEDYRENLIHFYGNDLLKTALEIVEGKSCFSQFTKTNKDLAGIEKHQKLIESYNKLYIHRSNLHN